ncbi:MAG: type II secretion system minor pseudopilin GspH [Woeseiaceae bacterium]
MNSYRFSRAFTLIEILVVITIIAIIVSIAVLSLGVLGDDRNLREEGRRMITLVQLAQDEATMQGREFGIEFMTNSYRFVEYDPFLNLWSEIIGDDTLRLRTLPEGVELDLYVEGQRVLLDPEPAQFEKPDDDNSVASGIADYAPHVLVFSSGDMTPFEVRILQTELEQEVVLESNLLGDIKFAREDQP